MRRWADCRRKSFWSSVDPLFAGVREKLPGDYATSDKIAGHFRLSGRASWDCEREFPIPVGAFDAHWDAIGAGCRTDDVVNVVGTSTCIIGITPIGEPGSRSMRSGAGQRASAA